MELLTFEMLVAYFDSITQAVNLCQNLFWTPHNENPHVINACLDVWIDLYDI